MARIAEVARQTKETNITIKLNLDGTGAARIDYPVGFMAHMLNTFARHGLFDLEIAALGDLEVDQHHLIEDTGIALGQCFAQALGGKRGIRRNGSCLFPMDETLARASADVSGRPFLFFEGQFSGAPLLSKQIGGDSSIGGGTVPDGRASSSAAAANSPASSSAAANSPPAAPNGRPADNAPLYEFQTDTIEDFWQGFVNAAGCNLHLEIIRGRSDHHKIEALFKASARALRAACEIDERGKDIVPSTKGSLDPSAPGIGGEPTVLA